MSRYTVNVGSDCSRRSRSSSCHKGGEGSGRQKQWVLQALVLEGCTYAAAVCVCVCVYVCVCNCVEASTLSLPPLCVVETKSKSRPTVQC